MTGDGPRLPQTPEGSRPAPSRARTALAWAGALTLVALHVMPWHPAGLVAGWLPAELAWRLAWMGLALVYLLWFCGVVWRDEAP